MAQKLSRPERLQVMLDADELAALDDWRFRMRMPSRAAAIRELLRRGLAAEGPTVALQGEKSSSYGVVQEGRTSATAARNGNGASKGM